VPPYIGKFRRLDEYRSGQQRAGGVWYLTVQKLVPFVARDKP
jgi:hypothetical protein